MQFPHRVLEWFLHLKEIDEFGQLDPTNSIRKISDEERERIARVSIDYECVPQGPILGLPLFNIIGPCKIEVWSTYSIRHQKDFRLTRVYQEQVYIFMCMCVPQGSILGLRCLTL